MDSSIFSSLANIVGENNVLIGEHVESRFSTDWTRQNTPAPYAVIRPRTTDEVSSILSCCTANNQRIVTLGGLTGMVRGAVASKNEIALSLERMVDIEQLDETNRSIQVRAGAILQSIQDHAENHGLHFPLDLGGRGSCTIGGILSTNAGGNRVIKYGMARDLVLGLEAVLANGEIITSMNNLIKNNAGYDLKHLFIGAEGTLGVITRCVLKLKPVARSENVALVALRDFQSLTQMLHYCDEHTGGQLSAFEVMWNNFYRAVTGLPHITQPLPANFPLYVLIETLGGDAHHDKKRFEIILEECLNKGIIENAVIAQSSKERKALWGVRDAIGELLSQLRPFAPFDISLKISHIESFVNEAQKLFSKNWPNEKVLFFGHVGDNNLHIVVSAPSPKEVSAIDDAVYSLLSEFGGSISAEHGIGILKRKYLPISRSEQEIRLMRNLKKTLDPKGLLNRDRIFLFNT